MTKKVTLARSTGMAIAPIAPAKPLSIVIGDVRIRRDRYGRYSLNDLHKAAVAAGANARSKEPGKFLVSQQTAGLIAELTDTQNLGIAPVCAMRGGPQQGTYVVKELVYAYAAWINPTFHLKVIRTYDAVVGGLHVAGLTLRERMLIAERQEKDSAQLASVGSHLLHERRRDKPRLRATIKTLSDEAQGQLRFEVTFKLADSAEVVGGLDRKHGRRASNEGAATVRKVPRKRAAG